MVDDLINGYQLECFFKPLKEIKIIEGSAILTFKKNEGSWLNENFPRESCELRNPKETRINLTYSTQVECDRTLTRIIPFDQGGFCRITKEFLVNEIFKTQTFVLQTNNHVYPFPYGFLIRYTCS